MDTEKNRTEQKRLRILGEDELEGIYGRPCFTYEDRCDYFSLSQPEKDLLEVLRSIKSKAYFILQLGYFRVCNYFKDKEIIVHFIKEGINTEGDMYKFLLSILGAVAEMEREITIERVRAGIQKAKLYGTKSGNPIGRPNTKLPKDFIKYYKKWASKGVTAVEFSKLLKVSRATLYRYIKYYNTNT